MRMSTRSGWQTRYVIKHDAGQWVTLLQTLPENTAGVADATRGELRPESD